MLKTIEGEYRDGKIELDEPAPDTGPSRVIVTFVSPSVPTSSETSPIDLASHDTGPDDAAALRASFGVAVEDWDDPSMDVWDQVDWDAMPQLVFTAHPSDQAAPGDSPSAAAPHGRAK